MFDEYLNDEEMKEDKILNNSYNRGEISHEKLGSEMKVHAKVEGQYEDIHSDNIIEQRVMTQLKERMHELFVASPYYKKYKQPKRVDKNDMIDMYYYFKDLLKQDKTFSTMEIFIGFAEFFQINYKYLYQDVSVLDKEQILKELHEKYNLKSLIETKRLF